MRFVSKEDILVSRSLARSINDSQHQNACIVTTSSDKMFGMDQEYEILRRRSGNRRPSTGVALQLQQHIMVSASQVQAPIASRQQYKCVG